MTSKPLSLGLAVAGVLLAAAWLLKQAEHAGMVDAAATERYFLCMMGLVVAFYGNLIPKSLGRMGGIARERRLQPVLRLSGWAFTIAGLVYAALPFFEPVAIVNTVAMLIVGAAMALTLISLLVCFARRPAE